MVIAPALFVSPLGKALPRNTCQSAGGLLRTVMAATLALTIGAAPATAAAQTTSAPRTVATQSTLVRDSFPIGSSEGALCQVQSDLSDPSFRSMFDRSWTIICRDASRPVGKVFALRGDDAVARINARPDAPTCPDLPSDATMVDCNAMTSGLAARRHVTQSGNTVFVAEGVAAYDDALKLALKSVLDGQPAQGVIRVATTSIGDAEALARIQVSNLPSDLALAEGYRRNNSGDYAEAAVFFEALERRPQEAMSGIDPSEFTLNRALQLSNLGAYGEAEQLFAEVEARPTADMVQRRLRRNFRAMHAINQRDYDGALTYLTQPLPPIPMLEVINGGQISISPTIASGINSDSGNRVLTQLAGDERLSPQERAIIIDAQADQLRGTILRLTGNYAEARTVLAGASGDVLAVRNGRVVSVIRLRAQILGEIGLVEEDDNQLDAARARLQEAIALLEAQYPETLALAAARAKYASFLARHGNSDGALTAYRDILTSLTREKRQLTGLYNQMAPYYRLLVDRAATDPEAASEFFLAAQLLVRPGVADTQAVLARELSGGNTEAATLYRQSTNLTRDLERNRIELARLSRLEATPEVQQALAELQTRIDNLSAQQTSTLVQLSNYPQYRAIAQDSLSLADLKAALQPGEGYAKLAIVGDAVYGLFATRETAKIWRVGITRQQLDAAVDQIRGTISVYEAGQYNTYPFDATAAAKLYADLFGPIAAELAATRHLIFEPDGAMLRLPVNVLITDPASAAQWTARSRVAGADPFDMRGVAWLGRRTQVSTAVSALAFRNTRQAPPSRAQHAYLGFGNNLPLGPQMAAGSVRGSAHGGSNCEWALTEWNRPIAPAELFSARTAVGTTGSQVVTGADFTDKRIRGLANIGDYRILHFATHGLVTPPRPECPTRPALLTSFDSGDSDGLLSFDEIFDLRIDADLVILSACDTAGQASIAATRAAGVTTGGGSALDGLVRAFIGAGGRAVLASHWPAPDDYQATERLVSGLFQAPRGTSIADALGAAELLLMNEKQTSHPFYWAGFAIIGDGSRPVLPGQTMAANENPAAAPVM